MSRSATGHTHFAAVLQPVINSVTVGANVKAKEGLSHKLWQLAGEQFEVERNFYEIIAQRVLYHKYKCNCAHWVEAHITVSIYFVDISYTLIL
jgi:hypothetical protein